MDLWGFDKQDGQALAAIAQSSRLSSFGKPGTTAPDFDFTVGNQTGFWYLKTSSAITAATSDTAPGTGTAIIQSRDKVTNAITGTGYEMTIFNNQQQEIATDLFVYGTRDLDGTIWVLPVLKTTGIIRVTIGADFTDASGTFAGTVDESQVIGVDNGDPITVNNYIKGTGKNNDPCLVWIYPDGTNDLIAHACA